MIMLIFSVHDKAVGAFLPPFFARSKMEAIRSFSEACADEKHQFAKHASDYTLYSLGEFDDGGARFSTVDPVRLITALECVVPVNPFTPANLKQETDKVIASLRAQSK